jgi:DNA-binding transcriptional ArsR family regulator
VTAAPQKLEKIDQTLAALADPSRRGVIDLLRKRPRRAGELAKALDLSAPAMSRHLRVLRAAGLVEEGDSDAPDDNRVRVYQLRRQPFASLRAWTEEVEQFWGVQLESFAAHVEKRGRERK